ncbi:MAG: hypothetical protein Q9M39_07605 [Sulfurovum sp.]|nr:hypothetical protein [Sulfurovum sp.]
MAKVLPKIEDLFVKEFKSDMKKFSQFIVTLVEKNQNDISSLGGSLNKYADSSKMELEDKAWELYVDDKYIL